MKKSLGAKTIVYPTPVLVVGTYDDDGKPNVMTAAWGGICCSVPPVHRRFSAKSHLFATATSSNTRRSPSASLLSVT